MMVMKRPKSANTSTNVMVVVVFINSTGDCHSEIINKRNTNNKKRKFFHKNVSIIVGRQENTSDKDIVIIMKHPKKERSGLEKKIKERENEKQKEKKE